MNKKAISHKIMRGKFISDIPSEFYQHITYLAKIIENGGIRYRRGRFEIGIGGYDRGYELYFKGVPICSINFGYEEFHDCGTGKDFGFDMKKIKNIFERTSGVHLRNR